MASDPATRPPEAQPPVPVAGKATPTIHEAELESGASGRVLRGATIDFDAAVAGVGQGKMWWSVAPM